MTIDTSGKETDVNAPKDFIRQLIDEDNTSGRYGGKVHTRFPPEPNGYLHIGHAKSICLNFGVAKEYNGKCNLRFDDTNPAKEDTEYVESIKNDVRWLGFDWQEREFFASDYFDKLYGFAEELIKKSKAYVDSQSAEEIHQTRGTLTSPGQDSPYRNRPVNENIDLLRRMKAGEFPDGTHVLRAKINMASPNVIMRDPVLYRVRHAHHHRTGDEWCIYPMYDFAHCLSDSIEGITHSLCTLEFENNRELYNWLLETLDTYRPEQTEFARLNVTHMVLSKRKLIQMVKEGHVSGWNDPRMPTLSGLRRRGYPPEAIRDFCSRVGVARAAGTIVEYSLLEFCVRETLNKTSPRVMAVLDPIKVVIENYPEGQEEWFDMPYFPTEGDVPPEYTGSLSRRVPFSREIYIERDDFREEVSKKFFRLAPGQEVRLRYAYYITCCEMIKNANGEITEIRCKYDPESKGGGTPDGRKVKGTLHWVSAHHAIPVVARLYEHLFAATEADVPEGGNFLDGINPNSLRSVTGMAEPAISEFKANDKIQLERLGYFRADEDSTPSALVLNRTVTLKDTWAKIEKKGG